MFNHFPKVRRRSLVILAVVIGTFIAPQIGHAQGTWTTLSSVPAPTEGMTVGGVGQVDRRRLRILLHCWGVYQPNAAVQH